MPTHSGKLIENHIGILAALHNMMRRENRLKELVLKAGGRYELVQDELVVEGLTADQYITIASQIDKEFPQ